MHLHASCMQTLHMVLNTKRMLHACILVGPHGGLHMEPYPVQLKCRYRITVFNNAFSLYIIGTKFVCTLQVHADDEFSDAARHTLVMGLGGASIRG